MAYSKEVRKLITKWETERGWPKRLEWIEIHNIRGWDGQRIDFNFPLMAIVGENGAGKSTILQAIAASYQQENSYFASDFFPDTPWDRIQNVVIRFSVREKDDSKVTTVRKPTNRWRGNPKRRKRPVSYIDLRRIQPINTRLGYSKIAKFQNKETQNEPFDQEKLSRFSNILGTKYQDAGVSLSEVDKKRWVPVVRQLGLRYSGFHQGAGESTIIGLLNTESPKYGMILIDELETSLHPRSQRQLVRDLANLCRINELQVIITTHSPYILEEIPPQGRLYVMNSSQGKTLITGVSPYFAMTQMDDEQHPDADLYVEDDRARMILEELLIEGKKDLLPRCCIIPYGAASVGHALGTMVKDQRFPRPSLVFLDADQEESEGCILLPGDDAPERVVFEGLREKQWTDVSQRIARSHSDFVDAAQSAMSLSEHHDWVKSVADKLIIGGNDLWRAMASCWVKNCVPSNEISKITESVEEALNKFNDTHFRYATCPRLTCY